jgi:hypothetical protein
MIVQVEKQRLVSSVGVFFYQNRDAYHSYLKSRAFALATSDWRWPMSRVPRGIPKASISYSSAYDALISIWQLDVLERQSAILLM